MNINLDIEDKKLRDVLKIIDNFIAKESATQWKSFKELYDKLLLPENQ